MIRSIMIHGDGVLTDGIAGDIIILIITAAIITDITRIMVVDTAIIPTMLTATATGITTDIPPSGERREEKTGLRDFQ